MTTEQDGRQDLQNDNYAFPGARFSRSGASYGYGMGMTLRDWFAGQALAGYFANSHTPHKNAVDNDMAEYCYSAADAMIAARS